MISSERRDMHEGVLGNFVFSYVVTSFPSETSRDQWSPLDFVTPRNPKREKEVFREPEVNLPVHKRSYSGTFPVHHDIVCFSLWMRQLTARIYFRTDHFPEQHLGSEITSISRLVLY